MGENEKDQRVPQEDNPGKLENSARDGKGASDADRGTPGQGATEAILDGLGKLVPGLKGLVGGLKKMPAFQERLKATDQEIGRRLSGQQGRSIIPPQTSLGSSRSTTIQKAQVWDRGEKDPVVDIFEEDGALSVLVQLPGAREEDTVVTLEDRSLTVSAKTPTVSYRKKIDIPYSRASMSKTFRNGVLRILVREEAQN